MKYFISILVILAIVIIGITLIFNSNTAKENTVAYPLKELSATYDSAGNLLQQILYNELTDDYIKTEYVYGYVDGRLICIDQHTTIITNKKHEDNQNTTKLQVYFNKDLLNDVITIIDNEYVKVSIVKYLAKDSWWEFGYELKVVNKTKDIITVHIDNATIMDINCSPLFYTEHVAPGDTEYFTLAWDSDTLERCYIPYIDNIEFMIRVFDNDNWRTPALCGERVLIKQ
jgi:hypothetical protein